MTTLFFAGAEIDKLTRSLLDNGVKNILYSFFYIHKFKRENAIYRLQEEYKDVRWFLDSGAFTYWAQFRDNPGRLMDWRKYKELYFQYVDRTWPYWVRVSELDLDRTFEEITDEVLVEWLEEMLDRWPTAWVMPVWHTKRGYDRWLEYCRDRRIKSLAVGSGGGIHWGTERRMVMDAHKFRKPVHGFAQTKFNTSLVYVHYDSIDSTSWLMGQKYGVLYVWRNNKFKALPKKEMVSASQKKVYANYYKKLGIDFAKIEADDLEEVRRANVLSWRAVGDRWHEMRRRQNRTLIDLPFGDVGLPETSYPWERPLDRVALVEARDSTRARVVDGPSAPLALARTVDSPTALAGRQPMER